MSTILKQPDVFSFSGNIKPVVISSSTEVVFELSQATTSGRTIILSEKFQTGADNLVTIPLNGIVDRKQCKHSVKTVLFLPEKLGFHFQSYSNMFGEL